MNMFITEIVRNGAIGNLAEFVQIGKSFFVEFELSKVIGKVNDSAWTHSSR